MRPGEAHVLRTSVGLHPRLGSTPSRCRGRDPATLSITVFAAPSDQAKLAVYREAGIDRVLLEVPDLAMYEVLRLLDEKAKLVKG